MAGPENPGPELLILKQGQSNTMKAEYGLLPAMTARGASLAGAERWQTPELKRFGSIQELTAGGTWYNNEGAKPEGSPGWEFVLP